MRLISILFLTNNKFFTIFYYNLNNVKLYHNYQYVNLYHYWIYPKLSNHRFLSNKHTHFHRHAYLNQKSVQLRDNCFSQNKILFYKRKYGLFKSISINNRKSKQKLIQLSNLFKHYNQNRQIRRKAKVIFYKKLNRYFYRAGRSILTSHLKLKKYLIQKYITKKIYNLIKNYSLNNVQAQNLSSILIRTNIFYTSNDSNSYICNFGLLVNNSWNYNPLTVVNMFDVFSLNTNTHINSFLINKKKQLIMNLKRIRFYKFRVKYYLNKKKFNWISLIEWLNHHTFVQITKDTSIEFDTKIMTGIVLKKITSFDNQFSYNNVDISFYMNRSYTWKYLT